MRRLVRSALAAGTVTPRNEHTQLRSTSSGENAAGMTALILPDYATGQKGAAPFLSVVDDPKKFGLAQRTFHNRDHQAKPWESSCIEVSGDDLRFYFETSTREGLAGFHNVARSVALGLLPGTTSNMMAAGFALWIVPRAKYQAMLRERQGIAAE